MPILATLRAAAARRVSLWWAVALAVLLTLPALAGGRFMDDFLYHEMRAEDAPLHLARGPLEIHSIAPASEAVRQASLDAGLVAWYTDPNHINELMRPLSSLTLALDFALWPDNPALAHAHSLLWYALLVLLVGLSLFLLL